MKQHYGGLANGLLLAEHPSGLAYEGSCLYCTPQGVFVELREEIRSLERQIPEEHHELRAHEHWDTEMSRWFITAYCVAGDWMKSFLDYDDLLKAYREHLT